MEFSTEHERKRTEILETCFECFCARGLENTGMRTLAKACNMNPGNLHNNYFDNKEQIILEATAHCMGKIEVALFNCAPRSLEEIEPFIRTIPYTIAREYGAQFRFMYQVYSSPKYLESGKVCFQSVVRRWARYANRLAQKIEVASEVVQSLAFTFLCACVQYTLYENEEVLTAQVELVLAMVNGHCDTVVLYTGEKQQRW